MVAKKLAILNNSETSEPNSATEAPISKLHEDLLWLIFKMNTETLYDCNRLPTIRRSSQVSRSWRGLLLRSSSLWGRLIDFDRLGQQSDNWRNEVLSRSGNSPLWVNGMISTQLENFVFSLLDEHWARIQRLDIYDNRDTPQNPEVWSILYRAAPHLKVVKIPWIIPPTHMSSHHLFDNNAPLLEEFNLGDVRFNSRSPSLSNIRRMTFSSLFSVPEMFEALSMMPLVEYLNIRSPAFTVDPENIPHIHLPRLVELRITGNIAVCLPFLERMTTTPGFSLFATITEIREDEAIPHIPALRACLSQQISKYCQNYFATFPARDIELTIIGTSVYFAQKSNSDKGFFVINIDDSLLGPSIPLVSDLAKCAHLSGVKKLQLNISDVKAGFVPLVVSVLLTLRAVVELETNNETLEFILDRFPGPSLLFPAHHTISTIISFSDQPPTEVFLRFMKTHRDAGFPIPVLNLQDLSLHHECNLAFLDELTGLVVQWYHSDEDIRVTREYVCGSGNPAALCFGSSRT